VRMMKYRVTQLLKESTLTFAVTRLPSLSITKFSVHPSTIVIYLMSVCWIFWC